MPARKKIACAALSINPENTIFYTGPSLGKGPMPAVFYFALSAEDSLTTDPYNQFVQFLADYPVRIFSLTLPGHENGLPPADALRLWAEEIKRGLDPFESFLAKIDQALQYLLSQNIVIPEKIAAAGLSRGAFIACHAAAKNPEIRSLLGFAPLTDLRLAKEFHDLKDHPLILQYNPLSLTSFLSDRHIRFYIGNRDTRVGTKQTFHFIEKLVESAHEKKIRSAPIEMIVTPSIGHQGHGTSLESFKAGSLWIADQLLQGFDESSL